MKTHDFTLKHTPRTLNAAILIKDQEESTLHLESLLVFLDPNSIMQSFPSPLTTAVKCNNEPAVKILLQYKANVCAKEENDQNKTCMHYAVLNGNRNIVQLLMDANAPVHEKDDQGRTAVELAVLNNKGYLIPTLLPDFLNSLSRDELENLASKPKQEAETSNERLQTTVSIPSPKVTTPSVTTQSTRLPLSALTNRYVIS